ncbi:MAG TPA: TIGR02281 family clan AA aspartic protease, partial [Caulobacteraceae bacterium]|nr:TIGR02281 family clan AA aspartic protease [Caulobacteraceae bacterium]
MVRFLVIGLVAVLSALGAARGLLAFSVPSAAPPQIAVAAVTPSAAPQPSLGSGEASIAKSPDGHFWADADVDGHSLHFL